MVRILIVTLALVPLLINGIPVYGGDTGATATYRAKTGDATFDATLGNLNIQTQGGNLSEFISNLSLSYNIPKIKIEDLIFKVKMTPADAYMTVGIASIIKKPTDIVVKEYRANRGKGWGVIAKRLGIKPGSKEFHALKNGANGELKKAKGKSKKHNAKKWKKTAYKGKGKKNKKK